jgi:hypothetical protein
MLKRKSFLALFIDTTRHEKERKKEISPSIATLFLSSPLPFSPWKKKGNLVCKCT